MKKNYFLLFFLISTYSFSQVLINEFEPNPVGSPDPANPNIELKGNPGTTFNGFFITIENDGVNGTVDRSFAVGGTFDANGLLVATISDLENPSFTAVLCSVDPMQGTDLDADNDGNIDNIAALGTIYDAIGIPDNTGDAAVLYGAQLGGQNFAYTGDEPQSVFRDGVSNNWYAVNDPAGTDVFDINANTIAGSTFDTDPTSTPSTFGAVNPTSSAVPCAVALQSEVYVCTSNTSGANNDTVTIQIPYTGLDATITSVTTTSGGSIGGDNPASITDGTIELTGLSEGSAWDITLNGGICDAVSVSGTVPANECDPAGTTCFDLSTGPELFELVTVETNTDGDVWTENSGTYSMNGYCGNGCAENVNTWLIFGPLDMTGVSDLSLVFDAAENFGTTDLTINYSSSYSGCPDATSWTMAQTITDAGPANVDLSAAAGTTVFIGIQYLDDGADGYSDWDLSNVQLTSLGTCPILGTRPTSNCASCDLSLQNETVVCNSNTAGADNDSVTIEIPYTGVENTITSVTTTSSGTIAGDDPATVTDGTIQITGLSEGDAWDITINGGDCDGTTLSGTVSSNICDPSTGDPVFINEFEANPDGADPVTTSFELKSTPNTSFNGVIVIIESDPGTSNPGDVNTFGSVSGMFDANGLLVVSLPENIENPSFTVVILDSFTGDANTDIDTDDDGVADDISTFGNVLDAIGIPDTTGDETTLYGAQLGGADFTYTGAEPEIVFRDGTSNSWYAVNNIGDDTTIFDISANNVVVGDFDTDPTVATTYGAVNPSVVTNSIGDSAFANLKIYPNPSNTNFITIKADILDHLNVEIFDIQGRKVMKEDITDSKLNISTLKTGIYLLRISHDNASITKKLIVE